MPESTDWPMLGGQMGLGALLGFAVGFVAKKAFKIALLVVGVLVVLGVSLQNLGLVTIHWFEIEQVYTRAIEQSGGFQAIFQEWAEHFGAMLPVTGSFVVGFLLGLSRG